MWCAGQQQQQASWTAVNALGLLSNPQYMCIALRRLWLCESRPFGTELSLVTPVRSLWPKHATHACCMFYWKPQYIMKLNGKRHLLMSLALRWNGSMASKWDSLIFSNLVTPNDSMSRLHLAAASEFDLQYLLTSLANIEYRCDICNNNKRKIRINK